MTSTTYSALPWIDWLVVLVYMSLMVYIGWRAARGGKSLDDYFVGERNTGSFAAGISLVATLLSTISYLAYPGEVIANGTGFLWQIASLPIVFWVVGYLLIPHIMSVPVNSAYELLERRLGPGMRTVAAGMFVLLRLIWIAFIYHTASTAISVVVGMPREWLILAMASITMIYTTGGGIRAVIWTDIVQFFVLIAGGVFTVIYLMIHGGFGPAALLQTGWQSMLEVPVFSFDPTVRATAVSWAISVGVWWIATCGSDQLAMQRFFTNRDAVTARRTVLINLVGSTTSVLILALIGLALLIYYNAQPEELPPELRDLNASGDKIFPYFIRHGMPVGLSGLIIAALLAAAMSSLSSGLNSVTTVLTEDFFRRRSNARQVHPTPFGRRHAQLITLAVGVVTLLMAYPLKFAKENFIALANRLTDPLTGPLFGLFAIAFFVPRADGRSAGLGFAAGLVVGYFFAFGHIALGRPEPFSFLWITTSSILATIASGWMVTLLLGKRALP